MLTPTTAGAAAPTRAEADSLFSRIYRGLSLGHVWIAVALTAPFIVLASTPIGFSDVWSSMAAGRWITEHGQLFAVDPLTTAPQVDNQIHQQWLGYLIYYGLFQVGGLEAIIVSNAIVATFAFGLIAATAVTVASSLRAGSAAAVYAFVLAISNLPPRNQTIAYALFGVYLLVLARVPRGSNPRWLWLLPPLMVLWANLHGSFFLGFVLLGAAGLDVAIRTRSPRAVLPYALTLAATVVAACVTPYGPGSLVYLLHMGTNSVIRNLVGEWAPMSIEQFEGKAFYVSVALLLFLGVRGRVRLSLTEWLLVAVFAWLALSAIRSLAWWGLATAPLLARLLVGVLPERTARGRARRDVPALNAMVVAVLLGVGVLSLPGVKSLVPGLPAEKQGLVTDEGRLVASEFLRDRTYPGTMYNNQLWGGYFLWELWPRHKPLVDGRIELHSREFWLDYLSILEGHATWKRLAEKYDVGYFVLTPKTQPRLIAELRTDPDWRLELDTRDAVIFARAN